MKNTQGDVSISIFSEKREKLGKGLDANKYNIGAASFSAPKPYFWKPGQYGTAVLPLNEDHEDVPLESGTPVYMSLNASDRNLPWTQTITE